MTIKEVARVLTHLAEEPLGNSVVIDSREYFIDKGANICIKGTKNNKEEVFMRIDADILFSAVLVNSSSIEYKYKNDKDA
jgi:hypothetical protein